MQHWLHPIQINIIFTKEINPNYFQDHKLCCIFLEKHPQDSRKSDKHSRYGYSTCNHINHIIFGDIVLIRPNFTPSSAKYVQWELHIDPNLTGNHYLLGSFGFIPITYQDRTKQLIPFSKRKILETICLNNNPVSPALRSISFHQIKSTQPNKTRKMGACVTLFSKGFWFYRKYVMRQLNLIPTHTVGTF